MRKAATIYDVAVAAGVSHQTVSRLLKGERVSKQSRDRIESALVELDYRPNLAARSLATRRSHRIGALMYEMNQLGPVQVMMGAAAAARKAGYVLDVVSLDPSDERSLREAISVVNQQDLAGILAFAPTDSMLRMLHATTFGVPVYVETEDDEDEYSHRPNVNANSANLATRHLLDLGHRSIAHISGPLDWPAARLRARAYTQAVEEAGAAPFPPFEGDWSAASGYRLAGEILDTIPGVTAIMVANDQMALGALHALAGRGLAVPGRVSVVGMDDVPESRFYNPSLTTIPMNFQTQGKYAFDSLLARMEGRPIPVKADVIKTELVQRSSSGPVPG